MATRIPHPRVIILVDRQTPVAEVIVYSRHVKTTMAGDPRFASAAALLTALGTHTDSLETAEAAAKGKGKGLADARNIVLAEVFTDLEALRSSVQQLVDANPSQGAAIATAAAMELQKHGKHEKDPFSAKMTGPGVAALAVKAVKKGASYEWQMSSDGGKTWIAIGISTVADMTVTNLLVGSTYLFRFRTTVGHTTSDWSQTISLFVH